jgi:hypothetical protein
VASSNDYTLNVSSDMQAAVDLTYPSGDVRRQYSQANDDGLTITTKEVIIASDMLVRY